MSDAGAPTDPDRLVWLDLEMTGLDVAPPRDRRDRGARHRCRPRAARRRDRPRGAPARRARSPRWTTSCATMHTRSGLLAAIEASDVSLEHAGAPALEYVRGHVPSRRPRRCAATRSASTAASSTRSSPSSTSTCTTAASTCRRSRSCAGAGTRRCTGSGRRSRRRTGRSTTSRESIAELRYYREHMLRPPETGATPD